ncbi:MAG: PilZ domain-containing protein [Candidatus Omnitrophica bacterium]|nr:PilZ domain-containing protein [Candidatus Omnitrophota bacterium]MCB9747620.1 PilZ domain-containing protein [Candidatus Omnitrophota bacterium]
MQSEYSFLKDELALQEIRKHKWIESEKLGQEIGFATAAVDWVNKYGNDFTQYRNKLIQTNAAFYERRKYRRYATGIPVELEINEHSYCSIAKDISLIGFSSLISNHYPVDSSVSVTMDIKLKGSQTRSTKFQFYSQILRINDPVDDAANLCFNVFIPFTENFREFLRTHLPFARH